MARKIDDLPPADKERPRIAERKAFEFHQLDVLGTSLDMTVIAPDERTANTAFETAMAEIERLRKILSTYDPAAELAKVNASTGPVKVSMELIAVLRAYEEWTARSDGAYSGHLGAIIALWKNAEKNGVPPAQSALDAAVARAVKPAWTIDVAAGTVTRLDDQQINVDSLGKGFIIGKAVAAARARVPSVTGLMLDIGGDILASGGDVAGPWEVGVADPVRHADNAPPRTTLKLNDLAVATSGSYQRFYTLGGRRYSHLIDPRTGQALVVGERGGTLSATVVARENATANALATICCILKPPAALSLVRTVLGAECLLVTTEGELKSGGFAALEIRRSVDASTLAGNDTAGSGTSTATAGATAASGALGTAGGTAEIGKSVAATAATGISNATAQKAPVASDRWPTGFVMTADLTLQGGRKRPFLVMWVEDSKGQFVRTVEAWYNRRETKYFRSFSTWLKHGPYSSLLTGAVSRATRSAGHYALVWDGTDQKGNRVSPGTYTVWLQVAGEKSPSGVRSGTLECRTSAATGKIAETAAFAEVGLTFGAAATK